MAVKTILLVTDFSKAALNAGDYAVQLANEMHAEINVIHIDDFFEVADLCGKIFHQDRLKKETLLQEETFRIRSLAKVEVECFAKNGLIINSIQKNKGDLIIMGISKRTQQRGEKLNDVITHFINRSPVPVIIVPERAFFKQPDNIVFACDYDDGTQRHTLDSLKEIAKLFYSHVYILNVKHRKEEIVIERELNTIHQEKIKNSEHVFYFSESDDFADGIKDFVEEKNADMVCVIPHHHDLLESIFHKSVSKQVVLNTRVPVLILPEKSA